MSLLRRSTKPGVGTSLGRVKGPRGVRRKVQTVKDVAELITKLKTEAGVL